jgi:cytochrome c oxidase assembly factor CtaG
MAHHLAWKADAFAASTLAITLVMYAIGLWRLRRTGGLAHVARLEIGASLAGWLVLALALLSPIATLSEWLFSAHMTQHELLMLVAAPLIAIGRPLVPMLWALPVRARRAVAAGGASRMSKMMTTPFVVFALHAVALWTWHLPSLYEAAVHDDGIHIIQHICFTGTAALFWWSLVRGRYGRLGYGAALIYIFATAVHSGGLGALLALSEVPWFPLYVGRAAGIADPLVDQQVGGFIMWVPSGMVMMLFGLAMFAAWLGEAERRRKKGWSS